jgi:hypothetical protein
MWGKFFRIISSPFYIAGGLCSIISVIVLCFRDKNASIIALIALCLTLILILGGLFKVLRRFLEKDPLNHKLISSFIQYISDDRENIIVETYKLIQVKCGVMEEYNVGFKWSGNKTPQISSDLQDFKIIKNAQNKLEYDFAVLAFKRPVLYNETAKISKRLITNTSEIPQEHQVFDSIPFDQKHKQYVYRLINPKIGYFYKINWVR